MLWVEGLISSCLDLLQLKNRACTQNNTCQLFASKDLIGKDGVGRMNRQTNGKPHVDSNEMDLGVTMLSSLGGGHVDDFARSA